MKYFILFCLCALGAPVYSAPVASDLVVEPPSWWVGMKSSQLQLLLRGAQFEGAKVNVSAYPGVTLDKFTVLENNRYATIDLQIEPLAQAGTLNLMVHFANGERQSIAYSLAARSKDSASRSGFSARDVVYLINPDRFANGDASNDSVVSLSERANPTNPDGRHGGDLQGTIDQLDYLADLGVTQLWLTPALENNQPNYSYHGYAITDFYQIDARMGDNQLYRQLSQQAKQKGVGLIMDMVLNHSGSEHWWLKNPPTTDWINFSGTFSGTSHARQTIQDPYASEADKKQFSDGWFVPTMPDLNQRQPILATYLIQNALWWIEFADLSGIRVDTYSYSDKQFLAKWTERIMDEYPAFNIVGEEWTTNTATAAYWQAGKINHDGYVSALPSVMDFSLQQAVVSGLNESESWNTGLIKIYQSLANDFLYADPNKVLVFADNHDMSRVFTEFDNDIAKTKMALGLLLTTRGIPQLYYATEVLGHNNGSDAHGVIRVDFPGGFDNQSANGFTGQGLQPDQQAMQDWLKKLLNYRKQQPLFATGQLMHFSPEQGVYVYFRYSESDAVMVVLNKNSEDRAVSLERFSERLKGFNGYNMPLKSSNKQRLGDKLQVPAQSLTLYELSQ